MSLVSKCGGKGVNKGRQSRAVDDTLMGKGDDGRGGMCVRSSVAPSRSCAGIHQVERAGGCPARSHSPHGGTPVMPLHGGILRHPRAPTAHRALRAASAREAELIPIRTYCRAAGRWPPRCPWFHPLTSGRGGCRLALPSC